MIQALLGLLTGRNMLIGGAALLVAALGVQSFRVHHAKADLAEARADLKDPATGKPWKLEATVAAANYAQCRANRETLKNELGAQNTAVERLEAAGVQRAADTSKALQAAEKSRRTAQSAADALSKLQFHGTDACAQLLEVDKAVVAGRGQ